MNNEDLMSVRPDDLAHALLNRRKILKDSLPDVIRTLEAEDELIKPRYDRSKIRFEKINKDIKDLKAKRDEDQKKAVDILKSMKRIEEELTKNGKMINLNPKWKREKIEKSLELIEKNIQTKALNQNIERKMLEERKEIINQNEAWLKNRKNANPEMLEYIEKRKEMSKLFKRADKFHREMIVKVEKAQPLYEKQKSEGDELREIRSQLDRARELLSQSDRAIKHWERRLNEGFGDLGPGFPNLLENMKMVENGKPSTFAKKEKGKKTGGEKAEEK